MPVVIIPLLASLIVGLLMFMLLGQPLAAITTGLTNWLNGMSGTSVDPARHHPRPDDVLRPRRPGEQGGLRLRHRRPHRRRPRRRCEIMAAVMAAGMVPPLAMALATVVRPRLFTRAGAGERQGRLAARRVVHLRGRDPVRGGRPAAGHPVDDGRRRGHRRAVMAFDVDARGRRTAASSCSSPSATCSGSSSPSSSAPSSVRVAVIAAKQFVKPSAEADADARAGRPPDPHITPNHTRRTPCPAKTVIVGSADRPARPPRRHHRRGRRQRRCARHALGGRR